MYFRMLGDAKWLGVGFLSQHYTSSTECTALQIVLLDTRCVLSAL